jgi:predicted RNA-binding Zn ribbon-like protein
VERFGPTRRGGPVFRWLGEPLAVDLANTVMMVHEGKAVDLLASPEDLHRWLEAERERLADCTLAAAHLEEVRAFRDAVRSLLVAAAEGTTPPPEAIAHVNGASAASPMAPQLEAGNEGELRAVESSAKHEPLAQLLGILARSTIAILTDPERERLQVCRAPSCGMFFLGARRWCCAACGNRARAARHYQRIKARTVATPPSN